MPSTPIKTDDHGWPVGMRLLPAADVWVLRMAETDQVIGYLVPDETARPSALADGDR